MFKKGVVVGGGVTVVFRSRFWEIFNELLDENGNPFEITKTDTYAVINKKQLNANVSLRIETRFVDGYIRVCIFINDNLPLFEKIMNTIDIKKILGATYTTGTKESPNIRRIETRVPITLFNNDAAYEAIEKALPIIMKYITVCERYLPEVFVDNIQPIKEKLVRNPDKGLGTAALGIYDECCQKFGWDIKKRHCFMAMTVLYASEATPEKYSPWFLAHSNLTGTTNGNWYNNIMPDGDIEEIWREPTVGDIDVQEDMTIRVTFAKNKGKGYVFLGMYKPQGITTEILDDDMIIGGKIFKRKGEKIWVKTYKLISQIYPEK